MIYVFEANDNGTTNESTEIWVFWVRFMSIVDCFNKAFLISHSHLFRHKILLLRSEIMQENSKIVNRHIKSQKIICAFIFKMYFLGMHRTKAILVVLLSLFIYVWRLSYQILSNEKNFLMH